MLLCCGTKYRGMGVSFQNRGHPQGAKESAEVGGRGTSSVFPMHLFTMALSRDGPPAALREVERRARAPKLSVLKRDPVTPLNRQGEMVWPDNVLGG